MTKSERSTEHEIRTTGLSLVTFGLRPSALGFHSLLGIRISDLIRHSHLSASIGSALAARRAGSQQAINATAASKIGTTTNVAGSVGPTPKSIVRRSRVRAQALDNPSAMPAPANDF